VNYNKKYSKSERFKYF